MHTENIVKQHCVNYIAQCDIGFSVAVKKTNSSDGEPAVFFDGGMTTRVPAEFGEDGFDEKYVIALNDGVILPLVNEYRETAVQPRFAIDQYDLEKAIDDLLYYDDDGLRYLSFDLQTKYGLQGEEFSPLMFFNLKVIDDRYIGVFLSTFKKYFAKCLPYSSEVGVLLVQAEVRFERLFAKLRWEKSDIRCDDEEFAFFYSSMSE